MCVCVYICICICKCVINFLTQAPALAQALDLDGDGEISEHEIRIALRNTLGLEPSPFLVQNVLRALDTDSSGRVSKAEWDRIERPPAWMGAWGGKGAGGEPGGESEGGATRLRTTRSTPNSEASPGYSG